MHDLLCRALVAWVDLARRFALWVTLFALALSGASFFYAAGNLGINTSTGDMISKDVPYRLGWEDFKRAFPVLGDSIVVVVDGDSADIAEDSAAALATRLNAEKELFGDVYWPGSDPFFRRNGLLYLSRDELTTLTDRLADAQPLLARLITDNSLRGLMEILTEAVDEVVKGTETGGGLVRLFDAMAATFEAETMGRRRYLGWQEVMSGDAGEAGDRRRIIIVQAVERQGELLLGTGAIARIRALSGELGLVPANGVRVRLTGSVPLDYEELLSAAKGAANAAIISVILVALLLFAGLRSPRLVLVTLATLLMGLVWTAAFATLTVGHLNLISVGFAVLFVGLGVDFGIHFALRYREAVNKGADHAAALREAAAGVGNTLTLCAVAAAIGFFSFTGTDFVGLSELGVISGSSMFIALIANLTLMPAFLTLLPLKPAAPGTHSADAFAARAPGWIEIQVRRKARNLLLTALVLGIAAAVASSQVRFDFNPLHLKDPDSESVATFIELQRDDRAAGLSLSVLRGSLTEAVALAARLKGVEAVDSTRSLADFVPKDQDEKLAIIDDMALLFTPGLEAGTPKPAPTDGERRASLAGFRAALGRLTKAATNPSLLDSAKRLAAAIAAFEAKGDGAGPGVGLKGIEDRLLATLPERIHRLRDSMMAQKIALKDLPGALKDRVLATDGRYRVEIFPADDITDNGALRRFVAAVKEVAPDATGGPVVILGAGDAVSGAMRRAVLTAFAAICILLLVVLRGVIDAALVLAPLVLAALLTVASAVALGLEFNFANIIVLPLLLSLGVASGIHLVMRARSEAAGVKLTETSTPRAVVFSAFTTIGSFGTLALSVHRGTASMGALLTIAIFFTLLCTLVVLPALMTVLGRRRRHQG
jgi:hopanoid biosynthesis associated RND transporter like protein HpnN